MAEIQKHPVTCSRCHYDSPVDMYPVICRQADPELSERLVSGDLFRWTCEVCGQESHVAYPVLYYDTEKKFLIFVNPDEDAPAGAPCTDPSPEYVDEDNDAHFVDYKHRKVLGMQAFREKLAIFEAGLDDVVVERMKYFMRQEHLGGVRQGDELYFDHVDTDPQRVMESGWLRGAMIFAAIKPNDTPDAPVAQKIPDEVADEIEKQDQEEMEEEEDHTPSHPGAKVVPIPYEKYFDFAMAIAIDPRMQLPEHAGVRIDRAWMESVMHKHK